MRKMIRCFETGAMRLMQWLPGCQALFSRPCHLRTFFYVAILLLSFISFAVAYTITSTYYRHSLRGHITEIADGYFRHVSISILDVMKAGCNAEDMRHALELPAVAVKNVFHATLEKPPAMGGTAPLSPLAEKAFRAKKIHGRWEKGILIRSYPLTAEKNCLTCHTSSQEGDVLAVVSVTADMSRRLHDTEKNIYLLFLLLLPVPLALSFFLAVIFGSDFDRLDFQLP